LKTLDLIASIEAAVKARYVTDPLRDGRRGAFASVSGAKARHSLFIPATKRFFRSLARAYGFQVTSNGLVDRGDLPYSVAWLALEGGTFRRLVLALEVETLPDDNAATLERAEKNFIKLLQSRSDIRVWLAVVAAPALLPGHLVNRQRQIEEFSQSQLGDYYLFVLFDATTGRSTVESYRKAASDAPTDVPIAGLSSLSNLRSYLQESARGRGRAALLDLRNRLLSSPPGEEIDAIIFKTLDRIGSDHFLRVSRTVIYSVEGEADYRKESSIVLGEAPGIHSYTGPSGEDVYLTADGKEPAFWDCWWGVPHYTTDLDAAVRLEADILGFGRTVVVEEIEVWLPTEDGMEVRRAFRAEVKDIDGRTVRGPSVEGPAVAVLVAMLDYMFASADEPEAENGGR
jgi:hypothetical protein